MSSVDPTGRIAFITGAASGIGQGVAALAQRRAMKLALMDLAEQALRAHQCTCATATCPRRPVT